MAHQPEFSRTPEHESVDTPSTIIATIPGTLGYYPHESVVVLGLVADEDSGGAVYLGPVLRSDISNVGELVEFLRTSPVDSCIAYLGVLITRVPESATARAAVEALDMLERESGDPLIDVLWHVSEIAHGTPYSMVFGPDPQPMAETWPESAWDHGVVGSVVTSPAMKAMRDNGALPALDRADTFSYFDRADAGLDAKLHAQWIADMTHRARRRADELRALIHRGRPGAKAVVDSACAALRAAPAKPLITDERLSLHEALPDSDGLFALATVLARPVLRDCVIGEAVRHPEQAASALLAVARHFGGVIRANALSVWALVAISKGLSSWASAALATAQEEMPQHSMSAICLEVMAAGQQHQLVTTILQGCELACASILGEKSSRVA